ncbi:MAG: AraC family transcriptional regulator [Bacteroidota bacterium]
MENNVQNQEAYPGDLPQHQLHWIHSVEQYLAEHLADSQLTIPILAKTFSLSERQFHRRIKTITLMTPNLLIRKMRMEKAKQLLSTGACTTVAETAKAVGYNQADYFSRLYQRWHGRRPSDHLP